MKGETMSQAVNENGELIKIANYSRSELNKLKRKKYYCIDCNKRLILKVGNRNRPHFTHMSESNEKKYYGESDHRSEEHTSELQSRGHLVCRLLLEKKTTS